MWIIFFLQTYATFIFKQKGTKIIKSVTISRRNSQL